MHRTAEVPGCTGSFRGANRLRQPDPEADAWLRDTPGTRNQSPESPDSRDLRDFRPGSIPVGTTTASRPCLSPAASCAASGWACDSAWRLRHLPKTGRLGSTLRRLTTGEACAQRDARRPNRSGRSGRSVNAGALLAGAAVAFAIGVGPWRRREDEDRRDGCSTQSDLDPPRHARTPKTAATRTASKALYPLLKFLLRAPRNGDARERQASRTCLCAYFGSHPADTGSIPVGTTTRLGHGQDGVPRYGVSTRLHSTAATSATFTPSLLTQPVGSVHLD